MWTRLQKLEEAVYKSRYDDPIEISMAIFYPTSFNDNEDRTLDYDPDPVITISDGIHEKITIIILTHEPN